MYTIKSLPEFTFWLDSLEDKVAKGAILGRLKRMENGYKTKDIKKARELASLID